jgi:peptidoglycan-associated lipoprotein
MKTNQIAKMALLLTTLFTLAACSSTGEEASNETTAASGNSNTRSTQDSGSDAAARAAAEEARVRSAALATTVFYFDFDVSEFRPADRDVLSHHARDLAANPNKRIRLEGHADERGTREYNIALGERRAEAIQNYLIVNGAARRQIETVSYGEERPAQQGTSERAYQANRRVQVVSP